MSEIKELTREEKIEQRKEVLQDLVIHLNKVSDEELEAHNVETIVEGFWQTRIASALAENKPFSLEG